LIPLGIKRLQTKVKHFSNITTMNSLHSTMNILNFKSHNLQFTINLVQQFWTPKIKVWRFISVQLQIKTFKAHKYKVGPQAVNIVSAKLWLWTFNLVWTWTYTYINILRTFFQRDAGIFIAKTRVFSWSFHLILILRFTLN